MNNFDETASDLDMEPGGSHPTSTWTSTARNASGTPLYKTAYVNLMTCKQKVIGRRPLGERSRVRENPYIQILAQKQAILRRGQRQVMMRFRKIK
jgi:hypothetical protein